MLWHLTHIFLSLALLAIGARADYVANGKRRRL